MRGLLFGLAVMAALTVGVAQSHAAKIIQVDRDGVQCPKAAHTSIQAAVNAATPGDTIKVCADLYNESVVVNKPALTLVGASNVGECSIPTAADPTVDSIVTGAGSSFSLVNRDITLSGFVVQGSTIGIQTSPAFSGYRITNTTSQQNALDGLNLNGSGVSQSRVDHNCFRLNARDGLASEIGDLSNALVDHNSTYRNLAGLDFTGAGARAYVTVSDNAAVEDSFSSYSMTNSIGSSIDHNEAVGTPRLVGFGSAIDIGGANNGLDISYNKLQGGIGNGIRFDLNIWIPVFSAPSVGLTVSNNTVTGVPGSGIVALGPTSPNTGSVNLSVFSNNDSSHNGFDGIHLFAFNTGNRIVNNDTDENGRDGIRLDAGATGNTIEDNHMSLNVEHDAHDDAFPANTWTGNHCLTDFPVGLLCGA